MVNDERLKIEKRRNVFLEKFADWMSKAGLDPLDYELIEEHREDGVVAWYFQKRTSDEAVEDATGNRHVN